MNRIMLDLETYSLDPRALVLSYGACFFNEEEVGDSIYMVLDRGDQWGVRHIDANTMAWWDKQSDEAKKVLTAPQTPVKAALNAFRGFIETFATGDPKDIEVWGNGATFDNVVFSTLHADFDLVKPWGYKGDRCYRTLKELVVPFGSHDLPQFEGEVHNALADAQYQAAMCGRYLRGKLK